jgi:hypothetical protein
LANQEILQGMIRIQKEIGRTNMGVIIISNKAVIHPKTKGVFTFQMKTP